MAAARLLRPLLALLVAAPVAVALPARAVPPVARVRAGQDAFVEGSAGRLETRDGATWRTFPIEVGKGGRRLRLAVDHHNWRIFLNCAVVEPGGRRTVHPVAYSSSEVYVDRPAAGTWRLEVAVPSPTWVDFRLRGRLERSQPAPPRKAVPLLPNLRLVPPYEFTFSSELTLARYPTGQRTNPVSCTPDDIAEHHAVRCLRFSLGPANVGAGPMALVFPGGQGLAVPGTATQRVLWSDGRWTERPAGNFVYHATHMHYHHAGFGTLELLRVTDPAKGTLVPAGAGPKQGFCTGDVQISEWRSFANAPQFSAPSTCLEDMGPFNAYDPTAGTAMGLSAGWTDIYSWEQDGNYVDFPLDGQGLFVVRSTADASGSVQESNETDNTGYAYIRVTGNAITVLERGRGQSPWDPRRTIVRDGLPPLAS